MESPPLTDSRDSYKIKLLHQKCGRTIFTRSPLRPLKTQRSPACGSRCNDCCTCKARLFMPRRMSVWPVASHTRTPDGTGIIGAALQ